jgi:threonine dehydratase
MPGDARPADAGDLRASPDPAWAARLLAARDALTGRVHRTPVVASRTLDERLGARVFFKCENLQKIGAFKIRGATFMIARLPAATRARGVVAYSSGNHAQAVAFAARDAGIPAVIVMPRDAPAVKREATAGYGAEIVHPEDHGESREAVAERIARERGMALVPPFDHPDIIAGQGTAMLELFEEVGPLDRVLVPVGGGGLISGSALAARMMSPGARVTGVEPAAGADGGESFRTGARVHRPCGETIADGARTPSLGALTFEIVRAHVADMTTADDAELVDAMRFVWERMKLVVEPTAVLGPAPLLAGRIDVRGERVAIVLSGGNVDLAAAARLMAAR